MVVVAFLVMREMFNGQQLTFTMEGQLVPITAYIVMAISLNLTVGIMGELSLGHAGFVSVGAFSGGVAMVYFRVTGMITNVYLIMGASMLVGAFFAGVVGLIIVIPVLRLRGDFVALVTLAFGEIIRNIIQFFYIGINTEGKLRFGFMMKSIDELELGARSEGARAIVEGPQGIFLFGGNVFPSLPIISLFTVGFILIIITLFIVFNLVNSKAGRAIMALRDNRIAAESIGIPVIKYKLMAFVTSAALAGAAGTLFVSNFSSMQASRFNFDMSIMILVFVVLGGLRSMRGSIIAATILLILPEMLREFAQYRLMIYAVVLILVMLATNNMFIRGLINKGVNFVVSPIKHLIFRKGGDGNG
jgi:branched-chain amino acid transport system permease protein